MTKNTDALADDVERRLKEWLKATAETAESPGVDAAAFMVLVGKGARTILNDWGRALSAIRNTPQAIEAGEVERMRAALKPFANFAHARGQVPADMPITTGSGIAKRQLTMGDCYKAHDALSTQGEG